MPAGRPSSYSKQLGAEICARLAEGEPITKITKEEGMPGQSTIYRWLVDNKEFREMYESARKDGAHTLASQIQEIADSEPLKVFDDQGNQRYDAGSISYNKLRMEARKWLAAKYLPKVYGEKQILAGDEDSPLKVESNAGEIFDKILQNLELTRQVKK